MPFPSASAAKVDQRVRRKVGPSELGKWGAHGPIPAPEVPVRTSITRQCQRANIPTHVDSEANKDSRERTWKEPLVLGCGQNSILIQVAHTSCDSCVTSSKSLHLWELQSPLLSNETMSLYLIKLLKGLIQNSVYETH